MTYSSEDFERFYIRYKAEGLPRQMSIVDFCMKNKVPYNLFEKWYRDTRHKIVPVEVEGKPSPAESIPAQEQPAPGFPSPMELRIMIDLKMSNGIHLSRRNMSYQELRTMVERLEALC